MTRSSPNSAAAHLTTFDGGSFSNIALSASRSRCGRVVGSISADIGRLPADRGRLVPAREQVVHELPGNPAAVGEAELDLLLVDPVEVAAAGLQQPEAAGEPRTALDVGAVVVAV